MKLLRKPSLLVVNWVSSCRSFFLSSSTAATYIFTDPNCTITIITLGPCPFHAELQHFILRFIKMSFFALEIPRKEGIRGERRAQRQGEGRITLGTTLLSEIICKYLSIITRWIRTLRFIVYTLVPRLVMHWFDNYYYFWICQNYWKIPTCHAKNSQPNYLH